MVLSADGLYYYFSIFGACCTGVEYKGRVFFYLQMESLLGKWNATVHIPLLPQQTTLRFIVFRSAVLFCVDR